MIIYDYREDRGFDYEGYHYIIPKLINDVGITTTSDNLVVGDYLICGPTLNIVISSKTANDYIGSIQSNHLNNELLDMSANYDSCVLMIHGSINDALIYRKMPRDAYAEFLASCIVKRAEEGRKGAISVINFSNIYDAVNMMKTIHNDVTTDDVFREPKAVRVKFSEKRKHELSIQYMLKPAGVGPKKASAILARFGTIRNVANAASDQFLEVDGIGKKIANNIFDLLNTVPKEEE
jgi:DNA excision repair protein ERCC-4